MMPANHYPVSITDFLEAKKVGNYPQFYCILDDRIHLEYPIENATFVSCVYIDSIKKNYGPALEQDPVQMWIKTNIKDKSIFFRYYPTEEKIAELKKYKYYEVKNATKALKENLEQDKVKLVQDEKGLRLEEGGESILDLESAE